MATALLDRMRFADFCQRREIEQARDELERVDEDKSRFTANVHHELRTPLTLMLAPLDAILGGEFGEVGEVQRGYLKTMHSNGLRLLKLINNLLDLAKIEGRQLRIRRQPVRLDELVDGLAAQARPLAERKGLTLATEGLAELPVVNVDPEALEKIVVNLVGNALKFTEAGGRIDVRGAREEDGGVRLVVADTGAGLAPDQLSRIFDRFAQVDGSNTRRHEGTGIGLALVKELVALHGGRIWAESEGQGRGAQMHVSLPVGEADAEADEEVLLEDASAGSRGNSMAAIEGELNIQEKAADELRLVEMERHVGRVVAERAGDAPRALADPDAISGEVLIVEDNPDMRRLLADLVGREFNVRVAANGRLGLEQVREAHPDLVLTDVMMPEMSGTELCGALKGDEATRTIPVVLVTSKAEREMKIEGLELGADDYVTKPFHPRELMARVRSLVRLRKLREEVRVRNALLESTNEELRCTLAELKEAGAQLVRAERLAAVGELAAGVAHEVNNPVNFATNAMRTLRTYVDDIRTVAAKVSELDPRDATKLQSQADELETLRDELDFDGITGSLSELVAIATEGLERTHRLVGDLRDFAAPRDGRRVNFDVGRGLASTVQLMKHVTAEAEVEVRAEIPEGLAPVVGDAGELNQVFLNLIKNATEAFESTGGVIFIRARQGGGEVVVEIQDNGPGIAPDVRERLFEPFFTTKEAGRGTGLGLSISRRIIDDHGGSIEVESALGEGTTVTVRLPIEGDARAA